MGVDDYWREANALADALLPIPPRLCLDSNGKIMRDERCLKCPMRTQCKLKECEDG